MKESRKKTEKVLHWSPRILAILFIGFLMLFSLDVFQPGRSAGEALLGFLIHNIPSFLLILLLVIAWKMELVGAAGFFGAGLFYTVFVLTRPGDAGPTWYVAMTWILTIGGPAFAIAALFLADWKRKRRPHDR